jgi:hypothetical protein
VAHKRGNLGERRGALQKGAFGREGSAPGETAPPVVQEPDALQLRQPLLSLDVLKLRVASAEIGDGPIVPIDAWLNQTRDTSTLTAAAKSSGNSG